MVENDQLMHGWSKIDPCQVSFHNRNSEADATIDKIMLNAS